MRKQIEVEVTIPLTPNFLQVGDKTTPVQEFTEEELRQIGAEWTEALVLKGREKLKRS